MSLGLGLPLARVRPAPARVPWPLRLLPGALCLAFLAYVFVGTMPMTEPSTVVSGSGNDTERLAVLALAALACAVVGLRLPAAVRLARAAWPLWLTLGWFCASVSWAAFPDVSLRRFSVMVLITVVALAVAAGVRSLGRIHALLVGLLAAVIAADIAVTVLNPGFAVDDLGVRGFHQQKNVAGLVAMIAVLAGVGWVLARPRPARVLAGLAFLAVAFGFLLITRSKTSLMLAVLGAAMIPALLWLRGRGPAVAVALGLLALGAVTVAALGVAAFDGSLINLLTPGNDASFTGRTVIWDFADAEIARRPWTGFGFGSFWDVGDANDPLLRAPPGSWLATLKIGGGTTIVINEAHNGYLDLLLQGGYPALWLAVLAQALTAWALATKLFARAMPRADAAAAATFLALVLVVMVHNVTESSLWMRGQVLANLTILISLLAFRREPAPGGGPETVRSAP